MGSVRTWVVAAAVGLALCAGGVAIAPVAQADGIERPRAKKPAPPRRAAPPSREAPVTVPPAPIYAPPPAPVGPQTVSLADGFFSDRLTGGVGVGVDGGCACGGGRLTIVGGGEAGRYSGIASRAAFFSGSGGARSGGGAGC